MKNKKQNSVIQNVVHGATEFVSCYQIRGTRETESQFLSVSPPQSICGRLFAVYKYVINTRSHINVNSSPHPRSNPHGLKPCSPHINEATPIFHHSRCVAIATRPFHLLIPHWVCIFHLAPSSPSRPPLNPPKASQSITL